MTEPNAAGGQLDETPMLHPFFGQPEDTFELINKYGTYNVQPTNEQENPFPAIAQALREADEQGIRGKKIAPFLLARVCELTGGDSLKSNIHLVLNNVRLAARIACAL